MIDWNTTEDKKEKRVRHIIQIPKSNSLTHTNNCKINKTRLLKIEIYVTGNKLVPTTINSIVNKFLRVIHTIQSKKLTQNSTQVMW